MQTRPITFVACLFAILAASAAVAEDGDERSRRSIVGPLADSHYVVAGEIHVAAEATDDIVAAGGRISVVDSKLNDVFAAAGQISLSGTQAQDLVLAGGTLDLSSTRADDLFAAGGTLDIAAELGGDAVLAGGRVRTRAEARIGGIARIAGGDVVLDGRFAKDVFVLGGNVQIDGTIAGNVQMRGGRIALGPAARIGGVLRYDASTEIDAAEGAVVSGGTERLSSRDRERDSREVGMVEIVVGVLVAAAAMVAGFGLLLAVAQAVAPSFIAGASRRLADRPWENLGIGIAIALLTPPLILLCAITIVGLPIAILTGLVYLALAIPTLIVLADRAGSWIGERFSPHRTDWGWWARTLWGLAGLVAIVLIGSIPFVGWAIVWLSLVAAFGALVMHLRRAAV